MTFSFVLATILGMEATRVQLTNKTKRQIAIPLTRAEKLNLKIQKVVELIESRPSGAPIKHKEFAGVLNISTHAVGYILQQIQLRGIIAMEKHDARTISYHVLKGTNIRTSAVTVDLPRLEALGKDFAWQEGKDPTMLRGFISFVRKQVGATHVTH